MTIKSVMTVLDSSEIGGQHAVFAAEIAIREGAHLTALAPTGLAAEIPGTEFAPTGLTVLDKIQVDLATNASQALLRFEAYCKREAFSDYDGQVVTMSAEHALISHSFYTDLIVVSQPHAKQDKNVIGEYFVEHIMLTGSRPILILPAISQLTMPVNQAIVAWKPDKEGARALREAIPLLRRMKAVEIVSIQTPSEANQHPKTSDINLLRYLSLHGVSATHRHLVSEMDVGNTLLSHAADSGADLLVMGGYGHSRMREWIMGGATRTILQTMTVPVMMSH
ncbi:MAG: universal stress protein [Burkholderiaceae bacterium]